MPGDVRLAGFTETFRVWFPLKLQVGFARFVLQPLEVTLKKFPLRLVMLAWKK